MTAHREGMRRRMACPKNTEADLAVGFAPCSRRNRGDKNRYYRYYAAKLDTSGINLGISIRFAPSAILFSATWSRADPTPREAEAWPRLTSI